MQATATNIVLISIALLATVLIVLPHAWRGFLKSDQVLSRESKRKIRAPVLLVAGFSVAGAIALMSMGRLGPDFVAGAVLLISCGVAVLALVYAAVIAVWHRIERQHNKNVCQVPRTTVESSTDADGQFITVFYAGALVQLFLTLVALSMSMLGPIDAAVDISLSNTDQNFDDSRWAIRTAIIFHLLALLFIGAVKYVEIWHKRNPVTERSTEESTQIKDPADDSP